MVYICEGVTDTIAAEQLGLKAVGVLGAASFKEKYVKILLDYHLTVIPDNDKAGAKFKSDIKNIFKKYGKVVQSLNVNPYNDLAEYMQGNN